MLVQSNEESLNGLAVPRVKNFPLKHVIEGKIERTGEDDEEDVGIYWMTLTTRRYCKLKEALDRIIWRTRFARGYGPVVRQTM